MNELPQDFFPADVAPEVKSVFENPEVVKLVMGYNKGLVDKRDELIGRLSTKEGVLKELGDVEVAKQKLSQFDQLQQKVAEFEKQPKGKESSDVEALRAEMQRMIEERDQKLQSLTEKRVAQERQRALKAAMKEAGVEDPDLLYPHIEPRVKTQLTDTDDVKFEFFTAAGTPLLNEKADPAGMEDLMKEFKTSPRYAAFFKADNIGGSGSRNGNSGNAGVDNPWMKGSPNYNNVAVQTKLFKENKALAVQLAAQAGQKLE